MFHLPDPNFSVISYLHQQQTKPPFYKYTIATLHWQALLVYNMGVILVVQTDPMLKKTNAIFVPNSSTSTLGAYPAQ